MSLKILLQAINNYEICKLKRKKLSRVNSRKKNNLVKKILIYIDPVITNGDSLFRYPTLKYHVPVYMRGLEKDLADGKVDLKIIVSDALMSKARSEGVGITWPIVALSTDKLKRVFQKREMPQEIWANDNYEQHHVDHYRNLISNSLGSFVPDIIIVYESIAPYFKKIFPNAIVVNETWGIFSRPPMPAFTTFDPVGTYHKSIINKHKQDLRKMRATSKQRETLNSIRKLVSTPLVKNDPCHTFVLNAKQDFRKTILLPLQIDNYFTFTECSSFTSHAELIEAVFENLPQDIGVIVTQHQDHNPTLNKIEIDLLRKKYRNFIYFDNLEHVPMLSNFILNYVDGVITTSSAVGFHAVLMKLPIFVPGESHLSFASSGEISDVCDVLHETPEVDFDGALHWILTHYQFFTDLEQSVPANFSNLIKSFSELSEEGLEHLPLRYSDEQLIELFIKNSRESYLIDIFKKNKVECTSNEIYLKICEAKVVSYDLFDTLIERPFIDPHFLFQLIEPRIRRELNLSAFSFMRFRRMAEEAARRERNWKETNLKAIYRHFQEITNLSNEECLLISKIELEAEKLVLSRRNSIFHTMCFAKKLGAIVSIITDIYLEEEQILEILASTNIDNYDHLFVSASLDKRKHDGTIFPEYLSAIYRDYKISAEGKSILHIGDNAHADCAMAQSFRIRSHVIPKSTDNIKNTRWKLVFDANFKKRYFISDVLIALIANRFHGELSQPNRESLFGNSLFRVGYCAAGPMLFSFVQWLIRKVREERHERVFFLARDGHLLKLIYDKIRSTGIYDDLPPSSYLHISRRAAAIPAITCWDDIVDLYHLSFDNRKIGDFIEARFGLGKDKIDTKILEKHGYSINDVIYQMIDIKKHLALLKDLSDSILINSENEKNALMRYLADNGLNSGVSNACFVDIGYSGSIQKYINRIFNGSKLAGYYLLTHEAARSSFSGVICKGFYNSYDEQRMADCHPLNDHIFLFESVLSSIEGSVVRHNYDHDGYWNMEVRESNREIERKHFISHVHAGVTEFTSDIIRVTGEYLDDISFGPYLGSKPFFHLAMYPEKSDAKLFAGLKVENSFGGGDAWLLYDGAPFLNPDGFLTGKPLEIAIGSSQWKEAAKAVYQRDKLHPRDNLDSEDRKIIYTSTKNEGLHLPSFIRKYLKFKKNPYRFFEDCKNPFFKSLKIFYKRYKFS